MQKFIIFFSLIIVIALFALQNFSSIYALPSAEEYTVQDDVKNKTKNSLETVLNDIYFNISTIGVQEATAESLFTDFYIESTDYLEVWGKYTDGRFGIDDLIIMKPIPGKENKTIEALTNIKLARINHFRNYDIYNSYNTAVNGEIYQLGDYYILMMMNDPKTAKTILEENLL